MFTKAPPARRPVSTSRPLVSRASLIEFARRPVSTSRALVSRASLSEFVKKQKPTLRSGPDQAVTFRFSRVLSFLGRHVSMSTCLVLRVPLFLGRHVSTPRALVSRPSRFDVHALHLGRSCASLSYSADSATWPRIYRRGRTLTISRTETKNCHGSPVRSRIHSEGEICSAADSQRSEAVAKAAAKTVSSWLHRAAQ